jgi:DNA-binding winged helix-turn-helix (wHTH) protein
MVAPVRFRGAGTGERVDGRRLPVTIPGLKVRALLADLLVHEGRPVPADRLIHDLWRERPPGNPAAALSVKVSQLRRALEDAEPGGRDLVVHTPAGYLLRAATDADRFRSLLAEAEGTPEPHTRAALVLDALATWRGPAFADFAETSRSPRLPSRAWPSSDSRRRRTGRRRGWSWASTPRWSGSSARCWPSTHCGSGCAGRTFAPSTARDGRARPSRATTSCGPCSPTIWGSTPASSWPPCGVRS